MSLTPEQVSLIRGLKLAQILKVSSGAQITTIDHCWITEHFAVCAVTFLVWDWLITFDDELRRVWHSRLRWRTLRKCLFFAVRYWPMVVQMCVFIFIPSCPTTGLIDNCLIYSVLLSHTTQMKRGKTLSLSVCRSWFTLRSLSLLTTMAAAQLVMVIEGIIPTYVSVYSSMLTPFCVSLRNIQSASEYFRSTDHVMDYATHRPGDNHTRTS